MTSSISSPPTKPQIKCRCFTPTRLGDYALPRQLLGPMTERVEKLELALRWLSSLGRLGCECCPPTRISGTEAYRPKLLCLKCSKELLMGGCECEKTLETGSKSIECTTEKTG